MRLAMIDLVRMGASLVRRPLEKGHECVVHDMQPAAIAAVQKEGATGAATLAEMVSKMNKPRAVGVIVPAAVVDSELEQLMPHPDSGQSIWLDGINRQLLRSGILARYIAGQRLARRVSGDRVSNAFG